MKDTVGQMNDTNITGLNDDLATRAAWFSESGFETLIGPPDFDLFPQHKLIPHNIDIKLRLHPHKISFLLITVAQTLAQDSTTIGAIITDT